MKAVCLVETGKPLELLELPMPPIGSDDVLIKVKAAGICHSDAHYRAGRSTMGSSPLALGHEVAGEVERVGPSVVHVKVGDRVCLHYNISCTTCRYCKSGNEQFCETVKMIGHHIHGGYAEYISVPARNAVVLPPEISFEAGATLMCASATALHALRKSRIQEGETVAIFGVGGLGYSAVQLAKAMGASRIFAIDLVEEKLQLAAKHGAIAVNATQEDVVALINRANGGHGVDIALELVGNPKTVTQAINCLGVLGRAVMVGLCGQPIELNVYKQVLANETEIIGSNDHLLDEIHTLISMATSKSLDTSAVVGRTIPLDARKINERLDELEGSTNDVRVVIKPED